MTCNRQWKSIEISVALTFILLISLSAFLQGDEMKKTGIQPIPMMDRDKKDEVPQGQVWTLSVKWYVYSVNKTCIEKTFYVLVNTAFAVGLCGLLNSVFCKPNRVKILCSSGKLVFKCLHKWNVFFAAVTCSILCISNSS